MGDTDGRQGHPSIEVNRKADELTRKGSSTPCTGPESALGVITSAIRGSIRDWVKEEQREFLNLPPHVLPNK